MGQEEKQVENDGEASSESAPAKGTFKEDGFWFFEDTTGDEIMKQFYHLSETNFPTELVMSRSDPDQVKGGPRQLYMVSKMVKDVLKYNDRRLKFINAGVPLLSKTEIK